MTATQNKVTTFGRRFGTATPGLSEFALGIAERPADTAAWLALSDWLRDNGYDRTADLVKSLWGDAPAVDGEIVRGFWQWENGSRHWEGVSVGCKDGQWFHCYWSDGNFRAPVTKEQAREIIGSAGKSYRHVRREQWTGETVVTEGVQKYDELTIRCG